MREWDFSHWYGAASLLFYCSVHPSHQTKFEKNWFDWKSIALYWIVNVAKLTRSLCTHVQNRSRAQTRLARTLAPENVPALPAIATAVVVVVVFVSISVIVISFLHILDLMAFCPFALKLHTHMLKLTRTCLILIICVQTNLLSLVFCCAVSSFAVDWFVKHLSAHELLHTCRMENWSEQKEEGGWLSSDLEWYKFSLTHHDVKMVVSSISFSQSLFRFCYRFFFLLSGLVLSSERISA